MTTSKCCNAEIKVSKDYVKKDIPNNDGEDLRNLWERILKNNKKSAGYDVGYDVGGTGRTMRDIGYNQAIDDAIAEVVLEMDIEKLLVRLKSLRK